MISAKFTKLQGAIYISHIDLLRVVTSTLRRADIRLKYSLGYNPHPLIKFGPPLSLGVASLAEYFTVELAEGCSGAEFAERFNKVSIDGITILLAENTTTHPNFAAKIVASDYLITAEGRLPKEIEALGRQDCIIEYEHKGIKVQEEVSNKIISLQVEDKQLQATLATGAENLRLSRLLDKINKEFSLNLSINNGVRTSQYVKIKDAVIDGDQYLQELASENNIY